MEAKASVTHIRMSPRKVKLVLDIIRNKPVQEAMAILKHTPRAACDPVEKLLKSAIANAEMNFNMDPDNLFVAECSVSGGPTLKRIRARAQGRAHRINKRTSHIYMTVKDIDEEKERKAVEGKEKALARKARKVEE